MKKKGFYFLILFAVVIGILYLIRYKQSQVFEKKVPSFATKVLNVNLRQIENHLLFDFLTNPITYLKSRKKKDSIKKTKSFLGKGVRIPKNILFYSNSEELKNNWFSSILNITNNAEFSNYLLEEKFNKKQEGDFVYYIKDIIVVAVKKEQVIFALNLNRTTAITSLFEKLFVNQNFLSEENALLRPIVTSKSDICFFQGDDVLEANFSQGLFEIKGTLSSNLFVENSNTVTKNNGVFALSGKINKNNEVFKQLYTDKKAKFDKITHLSLDSIVDKWSGDIFMNITSIEKKIDTIISYEYDDDFNKIEKKAIQKQNVPTLDLVLGQENTSSLFNYFYDKNAIQVIESDTVFTAIPIFKFLTTTGKDELVLQIDPKKNKTDVFLVNSKLNFYFNTEKYLETPLDISLNKDQEALFKLAKTMVVEWKSDNQFSFEINLKNKNRNFLGQLLKP